MNIIESIREVIVIRKLRQLHTGARYAKDDWDDHNMSRYRAVSSQLENDAYRHMMRKLNAKYLEEHRKNRRSTERRRGYAAHSA